MEINVVVRNKIAKLIEPVVGVCGNSDYVIKFDFDSEWGSFDTKTARFKYNDKYIDVVFDDTHCSMPAIENTYKVEIGVYAGDIRTTTPATLLMKKSIRSGSEVNEEPTLDVYNQIMNKLNNLDVNGYEELNKEIGELSDLETEAKDNLVAAINEVKAGGGNTQSDWEQNDETKADYVKNRICYKEEISEQHAVLCENVSVASVYQVNDLADISEHLQIGVTYTIDIDGYISTAIAYDANTLGVGLNLSNSSGGIGMIFEQNSSGKISWSGRPNLSFKFSISRNEPSHTVYHKIDSNYLPSEIFWVTLDGDEDGNVTSDKTPDEISAAYEAGYAVYAKYSDIDITGILSLSDSGGLYTLFTGTGSALGIPLRIIVKYSNSDQSWHVQTTPLDNVVTELSSSSTDTEVPSAKCVYDTMNQGLQYALPVARRLGISDAKAGQIAKIKTVNSSGNPTSWEAVDMPSGGSGADLSLGLTSASVGQIIKVKAVDENGKPTQWEAAEMPSGDKWELINEITFSESANGCVINTDSNGAAFSLKAVKVECVIQIDESDPFTYIKAQYNNSTVSMNASNSNKSGQVYYSCGALWMGLAGIMSIQNKSCITQNYNWGYSVEKMGFHYNDDWKQDSINQIKIAPNDGGKPLGAGTKIYVYGVRA